MSARRRERIEGRSDGGGGGERRGPRGSPRTSSTACSPASGAAAAAAARAWACGSSRAWSRRTAARSPWTARPPVAPGSDLRCPSRRAFARRERASRRPAALLRPTPADDPHRSRGRLDADPPFPSSPSRLGCRTADRPIPAPQAASPAGRRPLDDARVGEHNSMSAPNKSYDPVEVEAVKPDEVARHRADALAAISAAATLDELHQVKIAVAGDRSPLALANREIGALPPAAEGRGRQARRRGPRRGQERAGRAPGPSWRLERDERVLVEEAVDVTLPWDRAPRGARHPLTTIQERIADIFVGDGLPGRRRPRGRGRVVQLRRPELPAGPPGRASCRTPSSWPGPGRRGQRRRAAHPHLPGAGPHAAHRGAARSTPSRPAGPTGPTSSTPRTPRCSARSRASPSTRA